jgi:hypothetical protein
MDSPILRDELTVLAAFAVVADEGSADVPVELRTKTARTSPATQRRLMAYLRPGGLQAPGH